VTRDEQLQWEARWGRPVAAATLLSALLTLVATTTFIPKNRKGIEATPDLLLSINDEPGAYLASAIVSALAGILLVATFYYLFRLVSARGGGVPRWFVYIVIGAPLAYALSRVIYAVQAIDIADEFASGRPIRGEAGGNRASDLSDINPLVLALQTACTVGVAFLYVMLPLRARRVGLLTPFMGILGVIVGALIVFPFASISSIVQAFWLGAAGALFLGRWPGGRGPAWSSGEAEPWLTPAQRRAMEASPPELDASAPPPEEPEEVPERPASRKRKKKKRGR
jgi:hypothetical protein